MTHRFVCFSFSFPPSLSSCSFANINIAVLNSKHLFRVDSKGELTGSKDMYIYLKFGFILPNALPNSFTNLYLGQVAYFLCSFVSSTTEIKYDKTYHMGLVRWFSEKTNVKRVLGQGVGKKKRVVGTQVAVIIFIPSVQISRFSCSVMSDFVRSHGLQHTRPPCPSPTPGACSNSCPLSQWCHPTISSSVVPFSSCLQSFPASGSCPMSQFFTSGGQTMGVSASASVLPMNTPDWFPLGWTGWIFLQSKGLSRVFSNTTVQKHQFFGTQLSL